MSGVVDTEEKICQLQKEIADFQKLLREKEKEIKECLSQIEIIQNSLIVDVNCIKFIKNSAEIVSLEEYKEISGRIEEKNKLLEKNKNELSQFTKTKINLNISTLTKSIEFNKLKEKQASFGRLIEFQNGK